MRLGHSSSRAGLPSLTACAPNWRGTERQARFLTARSSRATSRRPLQSCGNASKRTNHRPTSRSPTRLNGRAIVSGMNEQTLQTAWRLHQAGNLSEASRVYQEVLRANPKHFQARQLLGFVHFQRGEFADAERVMDKAIKVNPKSVDALYNRGCALQALERHKEALQCFGKALAVNPQF